MSTDTLSPAVEVINESRSQSDQKQSLARPSEYRVLLMNDDYTPAEFVIQTLMKVFLFNFGTAKMIMFEAHENGVGCCGLFSRDVAETKAAEVVSIGRSASYPLLAKVERA